MNEINGTMLDTFQERLQKLKATGKPKDEQYELLIREIKLFMPYAEEAFIKADKFDRLKPMLKDIGFELEKLEQ